MNKPHLRYKNQTRRERTWTIHFIAIEKMVKGFLLIAIAYKLLSLLGSDVHAWATDFVDRHGINEANKYVHSVLEKLVGVDNSQLVTFSASHSFMQSCSLPKASDYGFRSVGRST